MFKWLHNFFYSGDPDVKVLGGVSEPEALMWQEILEKNGIPSFTKNMNFLSVTYQMSTDDIDLLVRRSDAKRAREILGAARRGQTRRRAARL